MTTCNAKQFFSLFFRELEKRGIPCVILHSYQNLPDEISSDIDYAVPDVHLRKLRGIQAQLAREHNWALVQTLQHGVFAYYAVLVSLDDPAQSLRLDACSSYARIRRFLVSEKILLGNRQPLREFFIPAPSAEFIYVLAKVFDAKNKSPAKYLPRLKELWEREPEQAQKYFTDLFGDTGRTLKQWFDTPADEWRGLGKVLFARNRFGPALMLREAARGVRRLFQPTGLCLAVLGSDGAGKTTLLANASNVLEPYFRYQQTFHFRPGVFEKKKTGVITDPHGQKPRGVFASWAKVFYYFADFWLGWWSRIIPARVRSTLVIFDRGFDDLLVDQKRYRLSGTRWLTSVLRRFAPKPDRTFVLSAPAELLHQRKPELPVEELARQQKVLQSLAKDKGYVLLSAAESPGQVTRAFWQEVARALAAREARRSGAGHEL